MRFARTATLLQLNIVPCKTEQNVACICGKEKLYLCASFSPGNVLSKIVLLVVEKGRMGGLAMPVALPP